MSGPACCACVSRRGMYTLHPEVRGTVLCVRVPKLQQQQLLSTGLQHQQQQQQCSFTSVVPSPGTAAGKPCSCCCCGGQDVSHSSSNTVDTTLSGNIMQFLFIILMNFHYIPGEIGRRSSTVFGFLMPCWYSYSYQNNPYIFGQGDMTCLLYTSPSPRDRQKSRMPSSA